MRKDNMLTIIVPCYNEEEVLPETVKELGAVLESMISEEQVSSNSKLLFVDDGSKDKTWELIKKFENQFEYVTGIRFSRNYGHQNALLAGLTTAVDYSDMTITIDADLQDDVNAIPEMVKKYHEGIDVVYGVRNNRDTDTAFKRKTAMAFYSLMSKLGVDMVPNSADYRLLSKRATEGLLRFDERNLFLRGMVPLVGYPSDKVYYARKERFAGESKYPLKKMLSFAWDGITSFSIKPISMIMAFGGVIVACSMIAFIYTLVSYFMGHVSPGWSSLMISIWFLGGVQLLFIGVVGQYVGKTYIESKERPRYNVEKFLNHEE